MTPVSKVPKRYVAELSAAMLLYLAALFGRVAALPYVHNADAAKALLLSPILPILLMAIAAYRFYCGVDEYQRLRLLKVFSASAGITIMVVASWSFLEDVGAPPLTNYAILGVVAVSNALITILSKGEDLSGLNGSFKQLAWSVLAACALAAAYGLLAEAQGWPLYPFAVTAAALTFVLWLCSFVVAGLRAR